MNDIKFLSYWSDSCGGQFKCKEHLYYCSTLCESFDVERCFYPSYHGHNVCDMLAGYLKGLLRLTNNSFYNSDLLSLDTAQKVYNYLIDKLPSGYNVFLVEDINLENQLEIQVGFDQCKKYLKFQPTEEGKFRFFVHNNAVEFSEQSLIDNNGNYVNDEKVNDDSEEEIDSSEVEDVISNNIEVLNNRKHSNNSLNRCPFCLKTIVKQLEVKCNTCEGYFHKECCWKNDEEWKCLNCENGFEE